MNTMQVNNSYCRIKCMNTLLILNVTNRFFNLQCLARFLCYKLWIVLNLLPAFCGWLVRCCYSLDLCKTISLVYMVKLIVYVVKLGLFIGTFLLIFTLFTASVFVCWVRWSGWYSLVLMFGALQMCVVLCYRVECNMANFTFVTLLQAWNTFSDIVRTNNECSSGILQYTSWPG